jgi:ribosomal-protein-alanine N-acetyltransferase
MLIGENIRLRPLKRSDMSKTLEWRNDLNLIRLTQGVRFPKTEMMESEWFERALTDKSNRNIYFGIDEIATREFIGITQLNNIDWISRVCEFGILIGEENSRRKGYATEAMNLLFRYSFDVLNLNKVSLKVTSFNDAAITLYKKFGFSQEGCLENNVFYDGEYHDVLILSLFREDY